MSSFLFLRMIIIILSFFRDKQWRKVLETWTEETWTEILIDHLFCLLLPPHPPTHPPTHTPPTTTSNVQSQMSIDHCSYLTSIWIWVCPNLLLIVWLGLIFPFFCMWDMNICFNNCLFIIWRRAWSDHQLMT